MLEQNPTDQIREAVDARLSGLQGDPWLAQRVLANVKGEAKVKKKLSVGFVLMIVLVLVAVTTLATALLWEQQVVPMKEMEQTEGDYMYWPISQKEILIQALIDSGNIAESDETARLFADATPASEKHTIADQLVLTLTGQTDVREISVDIITYAIMGSTDTWTPAQRVWWQQVTDQFYSDQGAPDTLITPTADVISEAEAIAIAKEAIMAANELPPDALNHALHVANLYVTDQRPDYRRWDVQFKILREGSDTYVERIYVAVVDEYGQVVDDPDVGVLTPQGSAERRKALENQAKAPLFETIGALYLREENMPIWNWSLETKAEYAKVVAPQVRAIMDSGDLSPLITGQATVPDPHVMASASYTYGLPGEQDIAQANALALAQHALMETYHLDRDMIALYDQISVYFDITNPSVSLWKFVFHPGIGAYDKFPSNIDRDAQYNLRYKVEINARTGEVMNLKEFQFQVTDVDLAYYLNWF